MAPRIPDICPCPNCGEPFRVASRRCGACGFGIIKRREETRASDGSLQKIRWVLRFTGRPGKIIKQRPIDGPPQE